MLEIMKPEEFAQVYSLMEESFPIDEFRPFHEQKQLLQNKDYCIIQTRSEHFWLCGSLTILLISNILQ